MERLIFLITTMSIFLINSDRMVLHRARSAIYPPGWQWPLPTVKQFVEQYLTFSILLKNSFITPGTLIDKMIKDLQVRNVTIPADCTIFVLKNDYYPTTQPSKQILEYYILQGPKTMSQFDSILNLPITTRNGYTLLVTKYGNSYYINGVSKVVLSNVLLKDGYLHVIENPISLPANPTDTCVQCYKNTTIASDIHTNFPKWAAFWEASTLPKTNVTVFPTVDGFYTSTGQSLYEYLLPNLTAQEEYLSKFIVQGIYYPSATGAFTTLTTLDGTVLTISPFDEDDLTVFSDLDHGGNYPASPRKDGVYYTVANELIPFTVPPQPHPPPEPLPLPIPAPIFPPPSSAGLISFSLVLLLLSSLFVLIF